MQPLPLGKIFGQNFDKFEQNLGKIWENLASLGETWAKSKSCIPKNIRSPIAMVIGENKNANSWINFIFNNK